jgi:magnesium chelatase subunit D
MARCSFPFTAVIGQERVKKALILNVINPRIGGVLISGEKGTAKSTLVRGLADIITGIKVIDLPLNITEDRLVGSIDIEVAIARGKKYFEPGILQRADGNILYVDEVNLLSEHIANCLLETAASGVNIVEREGISHRHFSRFILVGTMNPEEGRLRPQLIDRFGLYVGVHGELDSRKRAEIIRRRLEYERSPAGYLEQWGQKNRQLGERIQEAKAVLPRVQVSEANLSLAAAISREAGCAGHRAEIIIIEAARAIAAFDSRGEIGDADIQEAARYALPHRMRESAPVFADDREENPKKAVDEGTEESSTPENTVWDTSQGTDKFDIGDVGAPDAGHSPGSGQLERESLEEPRDVFTIRLADMALNGAGQHPGSGKRTRVKTDSRQGRYVKYRFPKGKVSDLAFDATLRAAAPFQGARKGKGIAVVIEQADIREKVKEKHTGCVILFVVDASGSMGARRRMGAVKGAVISMLCDVYQKRDRVGVIAFRKGDAATLLGITRSVDLAHKCLKELPTGGRTPLAAGLERAYELLKTTRTKEPDMLPYLVLVTDGRANIPLAGGNAIDDAVRVAEKIRREGINCLVLDTEGGYIRLGIAQRIAEVLEARYAKMDDVSAASIETRVGQLVA